MQVKRLVLFPIVIFFGACSATKLHVNVNSLVAEGLVSGKTYLLLPGNSSTTPTDLQFKEFSAYVAKVLDGQGYKRTAGGDDADVVIFLSYGVGNPKDFKYAYTFPALSSRGRQAGITTYKPSYGVKGYETYSGRYMTHFRFIFLNAYDLRQSRQTGEPVELWETSITSGGSEEDLRLTFPVLIAGAKGYIGVDTGRTIEVIMDQDDSRVMNVRSDTYAAPGSSWRDQIRAKLARKSKD